MFSLHTGIFARMFTLLAVIGLVMGGVSVEAMPQGGNVSHEAMVMHVMGDSHYRAKDMSQQDNHCATADAMASDCTPSSVDQQCDTGGDCCPHCVTALPLQLDASFGSLPTVQTATPQWRVTSVTPVTEIRPPIFIS